MSFIKKPSEEPAMEVPKWPWMEQEHRQCFPSVDQLEEKYGLDDDHANFLRGLQITPCEQLRIMNIEQKSEEWLAARKHRITASNFAGAIGNNKYCSTQQVRQRMMFGGFHGNAATRWGCKHEDTATDVYIRHMRKAYFSDDPKRFKCTFPGLVVPLSVPWAGCSPDGFVWIDGRLVGGLEIKCPFSKRLYPTIPVYYYDQIQGTMGFLNMEWWDFVVWTPSETQIRRFPFNKEYFEQVLYPGLEHFYMKEYLPKAVSSLKPREDSDDSDTINLEDVDLGVLGPPVKRHRAEMPPGVPVALDEF